MIRVCEGCKKFFEYVPPPETTKLKKFCDLCIEARNKLHQRPRNVYAGSCKVCYRPIKQSWGETCGVACSKKLYHLRQKPEWPAEPALCDELKLSFSWDECGCLL